MKAMPASNRLDEANCGLPLREFQARIDEGWKAAERGDTISSEEFEAEMGAWRAGVNLNIDSRLPQNAIL
jgi:hypothetical protein